MNFKTSLGDRRRIYLKKKKSKLKQKTIFFNFFEQSYSNFDVYVLMDHFCEYRNLLRSVKRSVSFVWWLKPTLHEYSKDDEGGSSHIQGQLGGHRESQAIQSYIENLVLLLPTKKISKETSLSEQIRLCCPVFIYVCLNHYFLYSMLVSKLAMKPKTAMNF